MRLHILSDLHLEREEFTLPDVDAGVVVLAGDIHRGTAGIEWAAGLGRPVLYVAGNHEFYGEAFPDLIGELRAAAAGTGVHVLENDEVVIDGVRFLGCALWSDFEFDGAENRERSMDLCAQLVNDYKLIRRDGRALAPRDTRGAHLESRAWLAERLAVPHDGPTVVVTHHCPVIRGRPDGSVLRAVAGAFASDLSELMGPPALWVFGHTHRAADLAVAGTRVLSNPRGYPKQPVAEFDPALAVDL
jgi:predicted phosphodiesterase